MRSEHSLRSRNAVQKTSLSVRDALSTQPSLTMLELMELTKLPPDRIRTEITKLQAAGAVTEITYFAKTKSVLGGHVSRGGRQSDLRCQGSATARRDGVER